MQNSVTDIILFAVRALIVAAFLILGWRDIFGKTTSTRRLVAIVAVLGGGLATMIFWVYSQFVLSPGQSPASAISVPIVLLQLVALVCGLYILVASQGFARTWGVARTTILEAWAGRVWLLPILWLLASIILISAVRPFDQSERIPLYINMLLSGQQMLLLVMMWVMACVSLPRERERKTIISTASKPLSRLELLFGKMLGFSTMSALMVLLMFLASYAILAVSDYRLKRDAAETYRLQKQDYSQKVGRQAVGEIATPPDERLARLSEEGSLFAYNYITVPPRGMSIVGFLELPQDRPPVRYIKGGSDEKIVYQFGPNLLAPAGVQTAPAGSRPQFRFHFNRHSNSLPRVAQIRVTVTRTNMLGSPPRPEEKVIDLDDTVVKDGVTYLKPKDYAVWEPNNPEEFISPVNVNGEIITNMGPVNVEVSCITAGVFLRIDEGADPDPVTGKVPAVIFNMEYVWNDQVWSHRLPRANPVIRGFERRDRQEIFGPKNSDHKFNELIGAPPETAIYRFAGKDLKNVPVENHKFKISLTAEINRNDFAERDTRAKLRVISFDRLQEEEFVSEPFNVIEKRPIIIEVPEAYLGSSDPNNRSDMLVSIECISNEHTISIIEDSVRLELPQSPFVLNLLKSELIIFFEAVLLIVVCVTCSVRLGWPVAMLCAVVAFFFGLFVDYIDSLQGMGLGALNYTAMGDKSSTYTLFDNITDGLWQVLHVIARLAPNFNIFQPTDYIIKLQNMPWLHVLSIGTDVVLISLPFIALAYLLFRKQEIG